MSQNLLKCADYCEIPHFTRSTVAFVCVARSYLLPNVRQFVRANRMISANVSVSPSRFKANGNECRGQTF